jgi:serine/threonine protein kinase
MNYLLNCRYLVLEKCIGTLDKFWSENDKCWSENDKFGSENLDVRSHRPQDGQALLQMAKGLRYIHSQKLVHGDINPNNIMIHYSKEQDVQLKLSDFSHSFIQDTSSLTPEGSVKGIATWLAPELLKEDASTSANFQTDVFSMGCVFAYFLSRGKHPFGENSWIITARIINGKYELSSNNRLNLGIGSIAVNLIIIRIGKQGF